MTTPSAHSLPRCPVEVTLSLISSRWVVLILRELIYGTRRFGQDVYKRQMLWCV